MSTTTTRGTAQGSDRMTERLRMASFGAMTALIVQYVLGIAYNLYGTMPTSRKSIGMFSSPLLAVHVVVGILILASAIVLVVRAVRAGNRVILASTVIALLAIIGAFGAGVSFTHNGANGASMGMAVATGVAMLCYTANLVVLGKRTGSRQPG
jgi:hypothetical protein